MISDSIAGRLGSAIWARNPMLGIGLGVGTGASIYAGGRSLMSGEGDFSDRVSSARSSAGSALLWGAAGTAGLLTVAPYIPGAIPRPARFVTGSVAKYAGGIRKDISGGRFGRIAERKLVVGAAGAAVGAAIGAHLDRSDPGQGARRGAAVGAVAGVALSTGLRASRFWKGVGPVGRFGVLGGLTAAALGGSAYASRRRNELVDEAMPEDNGLRGRMDSMSATGDLVLGLHNSR